MAFNCNTLIVVLLLILIVYAIYLFVFQNNESNMEHYQNLNNDSALLLKTHVWTDDLEKFANKIKKETAQSGVDFFILMHSENGNLIHKIRNKDLRKHVLMFKEKDITKIYQKGFYGMWLSNHWIVMWFYQKYKDKYQYFWSMEYDVRISGDSSKIWKYKGNEDFIYPIKPFHDSNWAFKNYYSGKQFTDKEKYYGYLQLTRFSNKFLNYLDENFKKGENGQDELIIFSLYRKGGFTGSKDVLNKYINDSWTVSKLDSDKHKKLFTESEKEYHRNKNHLRLFHPVK